MDMLTRLGQVTSGLDLIFAFIEEIYGATYAKDLQGTIEFMRMDDACDDPFAEVHDIPPSGDCRLVKVHRSEYYVRPVYSRLFASSFVKPITPKSQPRLLQHKLRQL